MIDLTKLKLPAPIYDLKRKQWVIIIDSADGYILISKTSVALKFDPKRYSLSDPKADAKEKKILTDSPWPHY